MTISRRLMVGTAGALALAGCSRLGLLNGVNDLTPGDGDVLRVGQDIAFGSDARQKLDVYAPRAASDAPVLVFFYGGSWSSGRRQDYGFAARAFAARGFVTVVPDYRLVPQVHYPAFVEDGAAAVAWTVANIARLGGNPAAIGVSGHSAGAYIALMLALDGRWLGAAGAPGAIKAAAGLAGPYDILPFAPGGAGDRAMGMAADLGATQPIAHASDKAPPVLLLSGAADTTVRPRNSLALADALTGAGALAETRIYPDVGHIGILLAISKPFRGRAPVLADSVDFLGARLGLQAL